MFFIMTIAFVMILPIFSKRNNVNKHRYEQVSITAVKTNESEQYISTPEDLPDDVKFYVITYTFDDVIHKICRKSVTVPKTVKTSNKKSRCIQVIAIDELGITRDVTSVLDMYSGPSGNFIGNDISLVDILDHHGFADVTSVLTVTQYTSWQRFFKHPKIQFHTAINVTDIIL